MKHIMARFVKTPYQNPISSDLDWTLTKLKKYMGIE